MRRHWFLILCFSGCLLGAAGIWRLCAHSDSMPFLPAHGGAKWIMDDVPVDITGRLARPMTTVFRKTFVLTAAPGDAQLEISAFKTASVSINGQEISIGSDARRWKSIKVADTGKWLCAGTNEIIVSVTNDFGPPALWLRLKTQNASLGTDASWVSSPTGSHWLPVRLATQPPPLPVWSPLNDGVRTDEAFGRIWMPLALVVVGAFLSVLLAVKHLPKPGVRPEKYIWLLLAIVVVVRLALWLNNIAVVPPAAGFDAPEHVRYIQFIQQRHALPLPNDGWEMHQPPLYYLVCAGWLNALGLDAGSPGAFLPLRAVNGIIGLAQCVLVLLCLRRLFPGNFSAQAAGLLVAAFLAPNLYLTLYVTNDPLAGLLGTAAVYFFLRWQEKNDGAPWAALGLGLALGGAVLTKLNCILAAPVFLAAMVLVLRMRGNFSFRRFFCDPAVMLAACLLACGWHYFRVWHQIGALPLPNSQTNDGSGWWQEPGYRTADYYLHFGRSLVSPSYSGLNSFADGIYSTLWADGQGSGNVDQIFCPPWYHDWMAVGGVLAVPLTLLAIGGLLMVLRRFFSRPDARTLLLAGMPLIFGAGIFYMTLRGPWLAHVKAFYALPTLVPFCALIAEGWIWLEKKGRHLQTALWMVVLTWTFVTVHAFWIGGGNFEFWRSRAIGDLQKQDYRDAATDSIRATELNPADVNSRCVLAEALNAIGKPTDAVYEYSVALKLRPDSPSALFEMAQMLSHGQKDDTAHAVEFATRACELTGYRQPALVTMLATSFEKNGQPAEARTAARLAWQLASQTGDTSMMKQNEELIKRLPASAPAP